MPAPVVAVEARAESPATASLPTGPFANGSLPQRRLEGALDQRAYRLEAPRMSLAELASPLRAQLEAQGFTVILDCLARACGGFDFRFAIDVMPEPAMHVDLGEFRFIAAERGDEAVSLLVSRSPGFGFVQVTRVGPEPLPDLPPGLQPGAEPGTAAPPDAAGPAAADGPAAPLTPADEAPLPGDIIARLLADGHVALDDLVFASGKAELEAGDFASLTALADWLKEDPARRIVLVGHTDASGALKANIDLSARRAAGVRQMLVTRLGVAAGQVTAEGVGPLAPRASNLAEEGRRENRRVEAVLTPTL